MKEEKYETYDSDTACKTNLLKKLGEILNEHPLYKVTGIQITKGKINICYTD